MFLKSSPRNFIYSYLLLTAHLVGLLVRIRVGLGLGQVLVFGCTGARVDGQEAAEPTPIESKKARSVKNIIR